MAEDKQIKCAFGCRQTTNDQILSLHYLCCLGRCQLPHPLTAGEHYSLFQLTAGLSPTTGEHAGKWVTVNIVCLPHICFTSALSTPPGKQPHIQGNLGQILQSKSCIHQSKMACSLIYSQAVLFQDLQHNLSAMVPVLG